MKRTLAYATAFVIAALSAPFTLIPAAHASPAATVTVPAPDTLGYRLVVSRVLPAHAVLPVLPTSYTVRPGDSLAEIAVRYCGHANDWTGFYHDNRKVIGANPNLIYPGQDLALTKCVDPPNLLHLGSTSRVTVHAHQNVSSGGKKWGVTYGYPNKCGDGDSDGWDVACSTLTHAPTAPASTSQRHTAARTAYASSYRGIYTRAGLEALWVAAGGPAWAAGHAAEIAICESGGNPRAYNPSGATGLFQILGQVVPGNLYNPYVNALNAVSKFRASGETFAQWVCQ